MMQTTVTKNAVSAPAIEVRMVLAFGAIYVLWGATFLAIRLAVLHGRSAVLRGGSPAACVHALARRTEAVGDGVEKYRAHRSVHVRGHLRTPVLGRAIRVVEHHLRDRGE